MDAKKRLLIVEDNAPTRMFVRHALSEHFDVYEAEDGVDGIQLGKLIKPDIIILDFVLPGMLDGVHLLTYFRSIDSLKHTPIGFITGNPSSVRSLMEPKYQANFVLSKPVVRESLLAAVGIVDILIR